MKNFFCLCFCLYFLQQGFAAMPGDSALVKKNSTGKTYTIVLILPFNSDKIDFNNLDDKKNFETADLAIEYYLGTRLALDSLARQGLHTELYVYDSKNDSNEVKRISRLPEVERANLIIGPVFPDELAGIASFSKRKKIYTISPLSPVSLSKYHNPYFIMGAPPIETHGRNLAKFLIKHEKAKRVIIIRSSDPNEYRFVSAFKKAIDSLGNSIKRVDYNPVNSGYEGLKNNFSALDTNYVFIPTADPAFLTMVLAQIKMISANYPLKIFGHPNWDKLATLDISLVQQLNGFISSSYHVEYNYPPTVQMVKDYRSVYSTEPSEYSIKGFDIAYFFGELMLERGANFDNYFSKVKRKFNHTTFNFELNDKNGFQNNYISILKYNDLELKEWK